MEALQDLLAQLPVRHRAALEWFHRYAGTEQPWPAEIETAEGASFLATRAKGIYKPAWSNYALSARQVLKSRYPEKGPIFRDDGTWTYGYFQENDDPKERDSEYTNRGLQRCWQDLVPIGVMRQTKPKPVVRYQVLGLALVSGWDGGYFFFEGFGRDDLAHSPSTETEIELLTAEQRRSAVQSRAFDADSIVDARERALAQIVRRRGQQEFRERLLEAYGRRCAITGCDAVEALEAAHIMPYLGPETNNVQNGLLLRADVHTLFDLGLIAVEAESMKVIIASSLSFTAYRELAGTRLREPANPALWPSLDALRRHREWVRL
ncbi:MAG: HNH endonuclease [Acidobacteria bacterium]|nr:HNH endonuclease [Acidobacteriota bacterium]